LQKYKFPFKETKKSQTLTEKETKMCIDAQKNPEKYSDLMVRVAGFTDCFIDLVPDVQRQKGVQARIPYFIDIN